MNRQLTQETYDYIDSTLDKLRNEIMYVDHGETRRSLMKQHDAIKRIIDGNVDECSNIPKPIPPEALARSLNRDPRTTDYLIVNEDFDPRIPPPTIRNNPVPQWE